MHASQPIRVAIDCRGGDFGPGVILEGICASREADTRAQEYYLCGDTSEITHELERINPSLLDELGKSLIIEECPQAIDPKTSPSRAWKEYPHAPAVRCISLQKEQKVNASVSAGSTGILLAASIFLLGCRKGVRRPALAAFLPTTGSRPTLLLDVGANLECRAEHLVSFAHVGSAYYTNYFTVQPPSVALLNIGREPGRGTSAILAADRTLTRDCPGYAGFVEGSDILAGKVDVVVCDGFAGNAVLKASESFHSLVEAVMHDEKTIMRTIASKMAILNSANYGSAPLVGIRGTVLKAHGASNSTAIAHALHTVKNVVTKGVLHACCA